LWIVVPGVFDANTNPRDLEENPLKVDYSRLEDRNNDYTQLGLQLAELFHEDLSNMEAGFSLRTKVPSLHSCHYQEDVGESMLADLMDHDGGGEAGVGEAAAGGAAAVDGGDMYANSIMPQDLADMATVYRILVHLQQKSWPQAGRSRRGREEGPLHVQSSPAH
jgi:hypothetical protein